MPPNPHGAGPDPRSAGAMVSCNYAAGFMVISLLLLSVEDLLAPLAPHPTVRNAVLALSIVAALLAVAALITALALLLFAL